MSYVEFINESKSYRVGETEILANQNVNFVVEKGEFVVILGASGAGKSTILNILGGMDSNDTGKVMVDGEEISSYHEKYLTKYRRESIGFVFQFYNLMPNLTALENVELAAQISPAPLNEREILDSVGLGNREKNFPAQLSGGEQQRVAIARALAKNPKLLLCDEPTGALDYNTGKEILQLLHDMCKTKSMTVIIVTHNAAIKNIADRVIEVKNGTVYKNEKNSNPVSIKTIDW